MEAGEAHLELLEAELPTSVGDTVTIYMLQRESSQGL